MSSVSVNDVSVNDLKKMRNTQKEKVDVENILYLFKLIMEV